MNTAIWRDEIVTAVGNLAFEKFFPHLFKENDTYPAFIVEDIVDRFTDTDESGEMLTIDRATTVSVIVAGKNNDWDEADTKCSALADGVMLGLNIHFEKRISFAKRTFYRATIGSREVMVCRIEFTTQFCQKFFN